MLGGIFGEHEDRYFDNLRGANHGPIDAFRLFPHGNPELNDYAAYFFGRLPPNDERTPARVPGAERVLKPRA